MRIRLATAVLAAALLSTPGVNADCVNKFTRHADGPRNVITLLTGKLTFQSAQSLATAIRDGKAEPLEWIDANGKSIARQFGPLRVVRPMPVGCDGNASGVIMIAVFPTAREPGKNMIIKLNASDRVVFVRQD